MIDAFDALNSVIRKKKDGSGGPRRGPGWKARQQSRDRRRDRNRRDTELSQESAAARYAAGKLDTFEFNPHPHNITNLGIYHPQFGHIAHGKDGSGVRDRMRGMSGLMEPIDSKRHTDARKKLEDILSGDLLHIPADEKNGIEEHHVHRDALRWDHKWTMYKPPDTSKARSEDHPIWSQVYDTIEHPSLAVQRGERYGKPKLDEEGKLMPHPSHTEDSGRIREHGIKGHIPDSVGDEASKWLDSLGIAAHRVRDKMFINIDGSNFMIPITSKSLKPPLTSGSGIHSFNPFNPENRLSPAPDTTDELWAKKVAAWRMAERRSHRKQPIEWAHRPLSDQLMIHNVPPRPAVVNSRLEEAKAAGWKEPKDPNQQMISPRQQTVDAMGRKPTSVEQPTDAQRRQLTQPPVRQPRPGALTGMDERLSGLGENRITASFDIPPMQHAMGLFWKTGSGMEMGSESDSGAGIDMTSMSTATCSGCGQTMSSNDVDITSGKCRSCSQNQDGGKDYNYQQPNALTQLGYSGRYSGY